MVRHLFGVRRAVSFLCGVLFVFSGLCGFFFVFSGLVAIAGSFLAGATAVERSFMRWPLAKKGLVGRLSATGGRSLPAAGATAGEATGGVGEYSCADMERPLARGRLARRKGRHGQKFAPNA
mmetsp:Transcript_58650/g.166741  ORF Transcript_58650/g.166741 Transcript_58650/m.166741 type:complete len:122 (-) Transcript_58650:7-372(-)